MDGSAVAPAATDGRIHVPVVDKLFAYLPLGGSGRGFPIQVGDLVERSKMILGGAMALQTPAHAVRFGVIDDFHVIDLAVAGDTAHAAVHVDGVVEINVVRRLVDPDPRNRLAGFP